MATVGIVMGSDSDMPVMAKAAEMLDRFGIDYEMKMQEWQHIFRECVQLCFQCRSSESQ